MKQYQLHGLIGGLGIIATSMLASKFESMRLLPMLFYIACIFLSIKRTRDKEKDGFLDIKSGVKYGALTAFIICIFYGVYVFIVATWEDPKPEVLEMLKSGMTNKQVAQQLSYVTKPVLAQGAAIYAIFTFMVGFFSSVIAALFLRKSKGLIGQD